MKIYLSEQDLDLLHHVARGQTYREAGGSLGVSEQTVKNRIGKLLLAFGARHITHLVAICIASDVIRVPDLYQEADWHILEYRRNPGSRRAYSLHAIRV